jgi:hypothetical protein
MSPRAAKGSSGGTRPSDAGETAAPVLVRTVFERFPITIKGAFVLRGGDAFPHQVRFERAAVARIPAGPDREVPVEQTPLDVAPRRDLFLPFEATIADLAPAWYVVRSDVLIDGAVRQQHDSKPFAVAWPRGAMRTGSAAVGRRVPLRTGAVVIEKLELRTDRAEVLWRFEAEGAGDATRPDPSFSVRTAGPAPSPGVVLEPLPAVAAGGPDAPGGRRRAVTYPVPKDATALAVHVTGRDGETKVVPVAIAIA